MDTKVLGEEKEKGKVANLRLELCVDVGDGDEGEEEES